MGLLDVRLRRRVVVGRVSGLLRAMEHSTTTTTEGDTMTNGTQQPRRGDTQTDPDGSAWRVVGWTGENGPYYSGASRVRVGSLAERVIFGAPPVVGSRLTSPAPILSVPSTKGTP